MNRKTFLLTLIACIFTPKLFAEKLKEEPVFDVAFVKKLRNYLNKRKIKPLKFNNGSYVYLGNQWTERELEKIRALCTKQHLTSM